MASSIRAKGAPGPRNSLTKKTPSKVIAKTEERKLMTLNAARKLTDRIKAAREGTLKLVIEAMRERIWLSMHDTEGNPYKCWNDYA
jgi:hypothetical protein